MMDTTSVQLTTGTGGSASSEGEDTSTSFPPIMTTTEDPGTSTSTTDASSGSTGVPIPPECGDGDVQADQGEECDNGPENADDAACTAACKQAACGDGLVHKGVESCDDGAANGEYNSCNMSCSGLGPRCGDGDVQVDQGEECDASDPLKGCKKDTCTWAASCLELKLAWQADATSGVYKIVRKDKDLTVYCDMDTDGGGYTFLKYANAGGIEMPAKDAETKCIEYGMHLFVPRTAGHLASAVDVAENVKANLPPLGGGLDGDVTTYLRIMGIYPVTEGESCPGMPVNSVDCPQWEATDHKRYWVTGTKLSDTQPSTDNCAGCSMYYTWDTLANPPVVKKAEAATLGGVGAKSPAFLCDTADKTEP